MYMLPHSYAIYAYTKFRRLNLFTLISDGYSENVSFTNIDLLCRIDVLWLDNL